MLRVHQAQASGHQKRCATVLPSLSFSLRALDAASESSTAAALVPAVSLHVPETSNESVQSSTW